MAEAQERARPGPRGLRGRPTRAAAALALLALSAVPAPAQTEVDLELVLMADASGSIDMGEIAFQRQGYADAITDPAVVDAILHGGRGRIAVTYVEWADVNAQQVVVPWMVIDGPAAAEAFAGALPLPRRRAWGRNAIGAALLRGLALFDENDLDGARRVIDFSADSANNWNGPPVEAARDAVVAAGITVNGLAVLCRACSGPPGDYDLEAAFAERIIGGPGAFVVTADSMASFAEAVRRKLILEIAGGPAGGPVAAAGTPAREAARGSRSKRNRGWSPR